jgi:type I restriction enzyme R subunit
MHLDDTMKSLNFEFLRNKRQELAALGGFAEHYVYPDPASALVKLRTFAEQLVLDIYHKTGLPRPLQADLIGLLNNDAFRSIIPRVILDKLHVLRIKGNKAAHGQFASTQTALELLSEAFDLARWIAVTYLGLKAEALPVFQAPTAFGADDESKGQIKRERKAALERLAVQEAQMMELLHELDAKREREKVVEKKAIELEAVLSKGTHAADQLAFDEATTRKRLIDAQLVDVGWQVGSSGSNTAEVTQEEPVPHQPTTTGSGYADYVLWDESGKPLAVIEAKKTSKSPELGRKQATLYADGLMKTHGQRPVIFYTNGFDIWIWDDVQGYPPRKLFGFYSKDSLQYVVFQRAAKKDLDSIRPNPEITGRLYQLEALRRVTDHFSKKHRKALIVQATGTGKTRVAVSLTELLSRARWVKRVLFLCDRRELRKQAKNVFGEFLSGAPLTIVSTRTASDRDKRVYMATYPAMKQVFQTFDVGFFDLIIADESHRSIYNTYGDLFQYFDCLQVGLTATPVEYVARNTYRLFDCEDQNPTAYYSLEQAIQEGYLVPFEVYTHTTQFLRRGIKYQEMSEEQRTQLEEDGEDPQLFNYDAVEVDKQIFNKDTNRAILRNLMEYGIRDETGQQVGKTIIFARSHAHAMLLRELFDELYPQYGGNFCQVIDNYDPRAEQLIDDLKGQGTNDALTIAISVDMLDTGIDIPEIVNLVFAKPIKSKVKFWQMIGRGTRLRPDLFGLGQNKKVFRIFDHWGNFDYFDMHYISAEPTGTASLLQQVFEARIDLAATGLSQSEPDAFRVAIKIVREDIAGLPEQSIPVREKWKEVRVAGDPGKLDSFDPATVALLRRDIAPLMQWVSIRGHADAYRLDLLIARMQGELLRRSIRLQDLRGELLVRVGFLQTHLNPVRERADTIKRIKSIAFWEKVNVRDLEEVRLELRSIMHLRNKPIGPTGVLPKVVDIREDETKYEVKRRSASFKTVDMKVYEQLVEETLAKLFDRDPTLQRIRAGDSVSEADLQALTSLVLTQNPDVDLDILREFYAETALPLDFIIRSIVGMDARAVRSRFESFTQKHPSLTPKQIRFLGLLQNHIARHGTIEIERLYEDPFTLVDADGLDGVFDDERQAMELIGVINTFKPKTESQEEFQ